MFKWRLDLAAPHDVVFDVFVRRIVEYHRHFTKELLDARQVSELGPDAQVVYQRFKSGFPFSPRDLCRLDVARPLDDGRLLAGQDRDVVEERRVACRLALGHRQTSADSTRSETATTADDGASGLLRV